MVELSLLERIEKVNSITSDKEHSSSERSKKVGELRDRLFDELPAKRIADLMEDDILLAEREIKGALINAARSASFGDEEEAHAVMKAVSDMVIGFGPLQDLLNDPDVSEIMANGPSSVYYEKEGRLHKSDIAFSDESQMRVVIDRMLAPLGRRVDEQSPMVSARLRGGHRVNVVISPLALGGPFITIRKFRRSMFTLAEMVELGTLDKDMAQLLSWAVAARLNIAVSGGTGSGKTTFLNALSCEIPHSERIITIEDSAELRFDSHPHVLRLEARPANTEGLGEVTIRDLVTNALRMRPDRIIVGECRGAEALDMLQAMNTGHDGSLTTLHANSAQELVSRLVTMVRFGTDLPLDAIEQQIASAIDLVIHLQRCPDGRRRVKEISECRQESSGVKLVPCVLLDEADLLYRWSAPEWTKRLEYLEIASSEEVEQWRSRLLPL